MKKLLMLLISATLILGIVGGCNKSEDSKDESKKETSRLVKLTNQEDWLNESKDTNNAIIKIIEGYGQKLPLLTDNKSSNYIFINHYYEPDCIPKGSPKVSYGIQSIYDPINMNGADIIIKFNEGWDESKKQPILLLNVKVLNKPSETVNIEDVQPIIDMAKTILGADFDEEKFKTNFEDLKSGKEKYVIKTDHTDIIENKIIRESIYNISTSDGTSKYYEYSIGIPVK